MASDLTSHTGNKSNPHGVTLSQLGITATATELNYVDGVTSAIQTQLDDLDDKKAEVFVVTWNMTNGGSIDCTFAEVSENHASGNTVYLKVDDVYLVPLVALIEDEGAIFTGVLWEDDMAMFSVALLSDNTIMLLDSYIPAPADHTHNGATTSASGFMSSTDKAKLDKGGSAIVTTAGTGAAYTATVDGITSLTAGVNFIMIPHTVSTSTQPTLDVNGLGAKKILRRTSAVATGSTPGASANWLLANYPFRVIYDGTVWIVEGQAKPAGSDVSGTVAAATKATQDGSGNVIVDTYATKTEVSAVSALVGDTSVAEQITAAIGSSASEQWTFVLEDGSTVTKNVTVK